MIINTIFNNYFNLKSIEILTYLNLLVISLYTTYNVYYNLDLTNNIFYLFCFIIFDTLLIPFNRLDTFIHHIDTAAILSYLYYYNIDIKNNNYATIQLLKTEISSIFLGTTYFLKKYNFNNIFCNISNIIFICTFFKYRIYDFFKNIYLNTYFFDSLTTNNSEFQIYYKYTVTIILYGLNLYWFVIILKILFKSLKLNLKYYNIEYYLQYSYLICTLSTAYVYLFNLKDEKHESYFLIDIMFNCFLSISSYYYHKNCRLNYLSNNDILDESKNNYKKFMLIDIFTLNVKGLMNVYLHLNIHNMFYNNYKFLFYSQIIIFITKFSYITYHTINKNQISNFLFILGINPFICIIYSSLCSLDKNSGKITLCLLFFMFLITLIAPFYKANHLFIHLFMIPINYFLALNNIQKL